MQFLKRYSFLIPIALLIAALFFIWYELAHLKYADIRSAFHQLPVSSIGLAIALTILNYVVLVGYDYLAIKTIGKPVPLYEVALASFIGFTTSYNFSSLWGGPAIRYRFYSKKGFSPQELLQILVMIGATFWIGAIALASILFIVLDFPIPARLNSPIHSTRWLGFCFGGLTVGYLAFITFTQRTWRIRDTAIPIPSLPITMLQIGVAALDLAIAAGALYALIGNELHVGYGQFLGIYLLAVLAVVISNVPAGIGVFELVIISFAPEATTSSMIAALLLFRVIYYLLPLAVAMIMLGVHELIPNRPKLVAVVKSGTNWWQAIAPYVFSLATFVSGAILLLSGATPGIAERLQLATHFVPEPLLEISHFLGSIVGACLLLLAHGLYRRLDSAYWMTSVLLAFGIVFSLFKGLDYEEAMFLTCILAGLLPAQKAFYRHGRLAYQPLSPAWIAAIVMVTICAAWLGIFSMRHSEYRDREWWQIVFASDAPRAVRATLGAVIALTFFAILRLLAPHPPKPIAVSADDLEQAFLIADKSPRTYAQLAMLGDKQLLFDANKTAYIMYARQGRSWIAMGDPVGAEESISDLVWEFREFVDRFGGYAVFYEVDPIHLTLYLDQGLTLLKIGEEARVALAEFKLDGPHRKGLRQTMNRMAREKITFEILPKEQVPGLIPRLREISEKWMKQKNIPEKGFSLGFYNEDYLKRYPCAVVKQDETIVAFANVWANSCKQELSIDLMRYDSPNVQGVIEYLFIELFLWGKKEGYVWFNLGMAPLSGIESRKLSPIWNRMSNLLFKHGDRFYHFEGLRQYKDKFDPEWTSRYIALSGGVLQWKVLADVTQLISRKRTS